MTQQREILFNLFVEIYAKAIISIINALCVKKCEYYHKGQVDPDHSDDEDSWRHFITECETKMTKYFHYAYANVDESEIVKQFLDQVPFNNIPVCILLSCVVEYLHMMTNSNSDMYRDIENYVFENL